MILDKNLQAMARDRLEAKVKRLRKGIREHQDADCHGLC